MAITSAIKSSASSIRPTGTPTQYLIPTPAITPTVQKSGSGGGQGVAPTPKTTTNPAATGSSTPPIVKNNVSYPYVAPTQQSNTQQQTPPPSAPQPDAPSGDGYNPDWRNQALRDGKDVNGPEFSRMREIEKQLSERAAADSAAQEAAQIAGAERIYNAERELLGAQKGEVSKLASSQRSNIQKQKELTKKDFEAEQNKALSDINTREAEGKDQKKSDEETLGRAWRDMSRQVQANMRARGIQDSQYAMSAEGDVTKDFNSGLRNLQTSYTKVFDNLSKAIVEINDFYGRQNAKLEFETASQLEGIDNWEQGQVTSIQGQENMSLARKLNAIQDATVKAQQMRSQVANAIDQQRLALETWLYQFNVQTKAAVEQAAYKNTVGQAAEDLDTSIKLSTAIMNQVKSGNVTIDQATGQAYTTMYGSKGNMYNVPVNTQMASTYTDLLSGKNSLLQQQAANAQTSNPLEKIIGGMYTNQLLNEGY